MSNIYCRWRSLDLAAVDLDWVEKKYPNALQILDRAANPFYHALQYAWDFARVAFATSLHQKSWTEAAAEAQEHLVG